MQQRVIDIRDNIRAQSRIQGMRVGRIVEMDKEGRLFVEFEANPYGPVPSRVTQSMTEGIRAHKGNGYPPVLLLFEDDDPQKPVIVDFVTDKVDPSERSSPVEFKPDGAEAMTLDGRIFQFNAREQIVLRCGKASITMTKAGKIIIRGAYLLNRSSGVNRVKGGSVQIN